MSTKLFIGAQSLCWDTKLAMGNGQFRRNGTYNTAASGRRLRRIKERELARLLKKSGGAK